MQREIQTSPGRINSSPVGGVIASSKVLNGEIVQLGQALFTVVDPKRTAITAQVASAQTAASIVGGTVEGLPSVTLTLQGAAIALSNGKVPVRFEARSTQPEERLPLAIGQPVTVIAILREKAYGIKLPTSSLVRNQNNEVSVWIKAGAERFVALPVEYQPLNASEIVITKGLSADNRVVVNGASLISQVR
jgi:membrane fusion protein, heavy metal efflux system